MLIPSREVFRVLFFLPLFLPRMAQLHHDVHCFASCHGDRVRRLPHICNTMQLKSVYLRKPLSALGECRLRAATAVVPPVPQICCSEGRREVPVGNFVIYKQTSAGWVWYTLLFVRQQLICLYTAIFEHRHMYLLCRTTSQSLHRRISSPDQTETHARMFGS